MKTDSIKKNYFYQLFSQLMTTITPLIIYPYISRTFGVETLGIYSYTNSVLYYFMLIGNLGISNYGNREIAKNLDDKEKLSKSFKEIFICHVFTTLISIILYLVFLMGFSGDYFEFELFQIIQLIAVGLDITWFYGGIQKFKRTSLINSSLKVVLIVFTLLLVKGPSDLSIYIILLGIINILSHLLLFKDLKKYIINVKVTKKDVLRHLKPLLVLCVPSIAISLYKYMDKIMLEQISSSYQLGLYEVAEKVVSIPLGLVSAIGLVLLPKISQLTSSNRKKEIENINLLTFKYSFILAIGITFGIIAVAREFIYVFFGKEYAGCISLTVLLAITVVFTTWSNLIRTQYLLPNNKDKQFIICVFVGAVVNLVLNFFLINKYQALGAVVSTIAAEVVVAVLHIFYSRKDLKISSYVNNTLIFYLFAILMLLIVRVVGANLEVSIWSLLAEITIGGIFYLLLSGIWLLCFKDAFVAKMLKLKGKV